MNIDVKLCQFMRKLSLWIAHKNVIHKIGLFHEDKF